MRTSRLTAVAAVGALSVVLSGCVGEEQVAVGVDSLTIATLGTTTASEQAFVDRMNELSEGSITMQVTENWTGGGGESDEIALTKAVLSGEVDIAWVTVRSLTAVGVSGVDALQAPLLVRTHDQQRAVALGVPGELISKSLKNTDVASLALLPGPAQYAISSGAPLLAPGDFAGKTFEVGAASPTEAAAITALGGTPVTDGTAGAADVVSGSVQAATTDLSRLVADGVVEEGPFPSSNVVLWPRMSMILINRDVLDRLSSRQHGFIDGSATRAQDVAMAAPDNEASVTAACKAGALFGIASADQLTALTEAVKPAYDALKSDPAEARLLEAIEDSVKRNAGNGALSVAKACRWTAPKD